MNSVYRSLCLLLARAVDDELRRMVQFLKVENEILRSKLPKRVVVTPAERSRLVRFGRAVGLAVRQLVSIVSPRTFLRWLNGKCGVEPKAKDGPGRPRVAEDLRSLVLRIAGETGWG